MYHWVISFIAIVLSHLAPCFFFGCWMKAGCMIRPVDGCEGDLARRFKSQKTVTEVLKIPLKVQGFGFSQCWPTKKIIFPFLFQITFTVIITDLFHVHILHSDCSRIQQTECSITFTFYCMYFLIVCSHLYYNYIEVIILFLQTVFQSFISDGSSENIWQNTHWQDNWWNLW